MKVDIITPDKTLFSGELDLVKVPGLDGYFEILNYHAPLVSILGSGELKLIDTHKKEQRIMIKGGVIEVNNNVVKILAE
jgi:F-type H+-transporting ATPase subunit epsilon